MASLAPLPGSAALALSSAVPAIPAFDYAYDDWVSTSGIATANAPDLADRPVRASAVNVGLVYDRSDDSVATNTARLPQDIAVSPSAPTELAQECAAG